MILQKYEKNEGIIIFHDDVDEDHADYNSQGLDNLYREEERHFWFLARKDFIFRQMQEVIDPSARIIEIGAGTGNVSRYLRGKGYSNISVGEMHINGLRYARSYGIDECYQFDLLRTPFENEFDAICMFDVLEHISKDDEALLNVHKMLRSNGHIVLTVPAHAWLWNCQDEISGHKRRYTREMAVEKLQSAGFDVVVTRYFFISLVPLLLLRRLLNQECHASPNSKIQKGDISINPLLNQLLLSISRAENRLNTFLPNCFGGSLLLIASKG